MRQTVLLASGLVATLALAAIASRECRPRALRQSADRPHAPQARADTPEGTVLMLNPNAILRFHYNFARPHRATGFVTQTQTPVLQARLTTQRTQVPSDA